MKPEYRRVQLLVCVALLATIMISACGNNVTNPTTTNTPAASITEPTIQPAAVEPKTLVVCLGEEPLSLYLYGGSSQAMWSILEAIYDGPIDTTDYRPTPVILTTLPTVENGGVVLRSVAVTAGDKVANVEGDLVALEKGVKVFPAGCASANCAAEWDGKSELDLVQMTTTFTLLPGLKWSDGQPLTAEDSVYSFELSADSATKVSKNTIKRTADYRAVDAQTVQWTGIPGYLTLTPAAFFWIPQPKHLLSAFTAEQLNTSDLTTKKPVGWGPYLIDEWTANDHIRLVKNPNYFRSSEGLPKFDVLVYRFLPGLPEADLSPIVTGECDIMDPSVGLENQIQSVRELEIGGKLKAYFSHGPAWELLNFGIKPASYDEVFNPYLDRQDFFGDVRVRQAFANCIDREKIISEVLFSQSQIPTSYLPVSHPYTATDLPVIAHDTAKGIQLLEETGWRDKDGDINTPRTADGVKQVINGTEFTINYYLTETTVHNQVAEIIVSSLKECGVSVTTTYLPASEMLAAGPDGVVFGRNFDLAELAWSSGNLPPCFLYTSSEIPDEKNAWLGTKYGGVNFTGYSNKDYDKACSNLLSAGVDINTFNTNNQETQRLIAEELPVLPLFYHVKTMVSRVDLCGLSLDASSRSPMNTVEALWFANNCATK
ncbi:MAG: peptide/nickel transport system substrate-binding protein [Chloroflexi bacterium]|nr:MAG: peptide/nickel transport system substrate-binding protein [Chloroflexota bacterium]MBA4374932.1 hypothetical protein [Anaerolinea sp.]